MDLAKKQSEELAAQQARENERRKQLLKVEREEWCCFCSLRDEARLRLVWVLQSTTCRAIWPRFATR